MQEYYEYFGIEVEEVKEEQRVEISNGLQEVPNGVANKYTSTTDIENALAEKALSANEDFDFIIAHMISEGEKAGEIEILKGVFEDDGIHVKFTSMSPVMIMCQAKNISDTPTDTSTDVASPKTGDISNIWFMFATFLISGSALVVLAMKRKSMI